MEDTNKVIITDADLLNTGTDITQTWEKAKTSIALGLSSANGIKALYSSLKKALHPSNFDTQILAFPILENLYQNLDCIFRDPDLERVLSIFLERLILYPNKISPARLIITEALFQASNKHQVPAIFDNFILHFLHFFSLKSSELWPDGKFKLSEIQDEHIDKVLDIFSLDFKKHPVIFKIGFGFALRQSSVAGISDFLDFQENQYLSERNFFIFLDDLIKEFNEIFEPKTLKEVAKWLEQKQTILEEAGAELFSFSKDITKNREEILVNLNTFKADRSYIDEFQKTLLRKKALEDYYRHKRDRKNLARAVLSLELDQIFLKKDQYEKIVRLIEDRPFDIFPEVISFIEKVNFISPRDSTVFDPIYRKEKAYLERKNVQLRLSLKENSDDLTSFHREWVEEPLKSTDADFPFFFVYALRQQKPSRLFQFLDHQLSICERPLEPLLAEVCEDYAELLTQETIDRIKKWTQERAEKLSDQKQSLEVKPDPLPDGYILIDTGLTQEEVKECFAFLHEVKDDDGNSFLSKADYDEVFRYGLAIPTGPISEPIVELYLNGSNFSLAVILHFMHKFAKSIQKRKGRSIQSLRSNLALFLYASFKEFHTPSIEKEQSAAIKAIRKRINNQKDIPSRSRLTYVESPLPVFRVEEGG
ncbi:hypothetical protein [Phaeodactylibacter xiamenensis]|uniref:hypothetical protein n=1 Tax=Phaeodactylibacter xiamenensis TaxID=1524460 RepID=UPI003BAD5F3E